MNKRNVTEKVWQKIIFTTLFKVLLSYYIIITGPSGIEKKASFISRTIEHPAINRCQIENQAK